MISDVICYGEKMKRKQPEILRIANARAGPRKCQRCKEIWNRPKGVKYHLCEECRNKCSRCNTPFTEKNKIISSVKYHCKSCHAEIKKLSTNKERARDSHLLRCYGITINEYESILELQGGNCWICERPPRNKKLCVDHKHEPGEKKRNPREKRSRVRGILCWHCNASLAKLNDNPKFFRKAAEYLEQTPAQKILNRGNNE